MTAREFAHLVNTPYPTVAQWLRDGRVPGATLEEIGNLKVWLIPKDVLRDFKRPEMGRPALTNEEKAKRVKKKVIVKNAASLPFEQSATTAKPKKSSARKSVKKATRKSQRKDDQ